MRRRGIKIHRRASKCITLISCLLLQLQDNDTPLRKAISGGHEVVVDMLLKAGDNPSAVKWVCI